MAVDDEEVPAAERPPPLREVGPQPGDRRHGGIGYELVLSTAVPRVMEDEGWDRGVLVMLKGMKELADEKEEKETGKKKGGKAARVIPLRWISENIVEQIVPVPQAISPRRISERIQKQNVEVPGQGKRTSERIEEQTVEFPVARSIPKERIPERIEEQIVESPVVRSIPQKRISQRIEAQTVDVRRAKGIHQERISERIKEQIIEDSGTIPQERISGQKVDIPVPCTPALARGGNSSSAAAPLNSVEWLGNGFFRTFSPEEKSATTRRESSAPLGAHSSSWTPAAYELKEASEEEEGPDRWIDGQFRLWRKSSSVPGRWFLYGSDETIFWDVPGKGGGPSRRR